MLAWVRRHFPRSLRVHRIFITLVSSWSASFTVFFLYWRKKLLLQLISYLSPIKAMNNGLTLKHSPPFCKKLRLLYLWLLRFQVQLLFFILVKKENLKHHCFPVDSEVSKDGFHPGRRSPWASGSPCLWFQIGVRPNEPATVDGIPWQPFRIQLNGSEEIHM